jgi:hypothetical protein
MTLAVFAVSRYLIVMLFCVTAYAIGRASLQRVPFANRAEEIALCTAFGLGVLSQIILIVGLFGWLTMGGIITVMVLSLLFALGCKLSRTNPLPAWRRPSLQGLGVIAALAIVGLAATALLLLPLYPPTDFDETMYHLAVVKMWVQAHAIVPTPFLRGQVLPHTAHTLFAALMILKDDIAAQILSVVVTVLTAVGLFGWGVRVRGTGCGVLAAALWLGSPAALTLAGVADYHALSSLFCFAALFSLAVYATEKRPVSLFLAAAFIGFAESTWPLTIYFVPVFAAAGLYFMLKERSLRPAYLILAGILLGWGPSLIRSFYYTGNPTYPLFSRVFGSGPWWTPADFEALAAGLHSYGLPRTIPNFLSLPYSLFVTPEKFESTVTFSAALAIVLPLVLLRSLYDRYTRWLALIMVYYVVCWFTFGQVIRYLLPIAPLLCVLAAISVCWFVDSIVRSRQRLALVLTAIISIGVWAPGLRYARQKVAENGPIPLSHKQRAKYLALRIQSYRALAAANSSPGPIYSLFGTNGAYYSDSTFLGDWVGPGRYSAVLNAMSDGETLYRRLQRFGAKYFLVNYSEAITPMLPYGDPDFSRHFQLIFENSISELYRLADVPLSVVPNRPNLLRNADFDRLVGGWPADWARNGLPLVGAPPIGADSGHTAVRVTESDTFCQSIRVLPFQIYDLRLSATQDTPGGTFRLQVNWIDSSGKICEVFIRIYKAETSWRAFSAKLASPSCARTAIIYASGQTAAGVWMDTFSFKDATANADTAASQTPVAQ